MFFSCNIDEALMARDEVWVDPCAGCSADVTELEGLDCYCGAVVCSERCFDLHDCDATFEEIQ